jgi:hypothetical protein
MSVEELAQAILADLGVRDDEDEAVVEKRRVLAAEYQALTKDERTRLGEILQRGTLPVEMKPVEISPDTQEMMAELKRHGPRPEPQRPQHRAPIIPGWPRTRPRAVLVEPDPLKWDEWTPTRPSRRVAFRNHPFSPLGPPDLPRVATWCERCGRGASAHAG